MRRNSPLDRLEAYFDEIERIVEEERPLNIGQKMALCGLGAIVFLVAYVFVVTGFQLSKGGG